MNALYTPGKERLMVGQFNLGADAIKALLIDLTEYTVNLATHDDKADIPSAAIVSTTAALGGQDVVGGVFQTDDFVWVSVVGDPAGGVVLFNETHANDALLAYYDSGITGFPVTPNGSNINGTVSASGWFAL